MHVDAPANDTVHTSFCIGSISSGTHNGTKHRPATANLRVLTSSCKLCSLTRRIDSSRANCSLQFECVHHTCTHTHIHTYIVHWHEDDDLNLTCVAGAVMYLYIFVSPNNAGTLTVPY